LTEDKILDYWNDLKKSRNLNTSKTLEEYISEGKGNPENFNISACCTFWDYPSNLVKEMKSGNNSDMAKRVLYVMSKLSQRGCMLTYYYSKSNLEVCQKLGYSFGEVIDSIDFSRGYTDYSAISQDFVNLYGEETLEYLTSAKLEAEYSVKFKDYKFLTMIGILVEFVMQDYEKYKEYIPVIYKYINKFNSGCQLGIICRMYNLNDETMVQFKKCAENISYYTAMSNYFKRYHGGVFKEEIYKLGFKKNYYHAFMKNYFNLADDVFRKGLDELYNEDKTMFADVCYDIIQNKQQYGSEIAIYALTVMLMNNDGQRELGAAAEKVSHYIHLLVDDINNTGIKGVEKVINFADFVKLMNSDEISVKDLDLKFRKYRYCGGIERTFKIMSLLYDLFEPAKKCINLLMLYADSKSENCHISSFYIEFVTQRKRWLKIPQSESINALAKVLPVAAFFKIYCFANSNNWYQSRIKIDKIEIIRLVSENPDKALEYFGQIKDINYTSAWLELYYSIDMEKDFSPLIDALKGKSKILRKKSFEIAENFENEIRSELEKILPKLKGEGNINVSQLIKKWDNIRKFGKDFAFASNEFTEEFCKENLNSSAVRKISWIDEQCFEGIRYADLSGTASPNIMKYIISEYMIIDEPYRITICDKVVNCLNKSDFQSSLENIFRLWVEDGADTKKKFISLPYCIYASDTQILKLKKQLEVWAGASRGALASFVVKNIALNGGSIALLTIDTISKKFPNNMVKNAAKDAISFAAESFEISVDELTDRIVPNLGFDKNGEKIFDYGARTFTVSLMPDFSLSIHDNAKNKDIKNLPKPNDKDDMIKAENAKKELSELKKQIKAVIASQKQRLERVLMNGRTWSVEKWRNLFEENAVMHCFAEKLIWGTYEDGKLKDTFRYLSDGSFCNEEDDEYELPENAQITLVHPVELSNELIAKWSEQLEDYEIIQPFNQLFAKVIKLNDDDISPDNTVVKYDGKQFTVSKISSAAKKYDMSRGAVLDGGGFDGYELTDTYLGITMLICADMLYFGQNYDEIVTMQELKFYMLEDLKQISVNPKALSSRFVSSCLEIVENIVDM
jgi:hypothetical protein